MHKEAGFYKGMAYLSSANVNTFLDTFYDLTILLPVQVGNNQS
jgi:hypothetical protein